MDKIKIGDRVIVTGMERKHPDFNFRICKVKERYMSTLNGWTVEYEDEDLLHSINVSEEYLVPLGCENIKDLEGLENPLEIMVNLFNEYKGYYEMICRIANDFSISEDNLRIENEKLHNQIMDTESKQNSEIAKYKCHIEEMQSHIEQLKSELEAKPVEFLPESAIVVSEYLIEKTLSYKNILGQESNGWYYSKSELKQIAEHLLVYVNNSEDDR